MNDQPEIDPQVGSMLRMARSMMSHDQSPLKPLNAKPIEIARGRVRMALTLAPDFTAKDGLVHGGLLTIILDSFFGMTVFTTLSEMTPIATVNLRTDYIKNAAVGAEVICETQWLGTRRAIATVSGRIVSAGNNDLIATAAGAFMIGTRGPEGRKTS